MRRQTHTQPHPPLLARLLDTPGLPAIVRDLQSEVLHRLIRHCGLEDSGPLIALATPEQLNDVLDLDLWRAPQAGADEALDAERFGVWLAVLAESGSDTVTQVVSGMDPSLVATVLAQHVRVFDVGALVAAGEDAGEPGDGGPAAADGLTCELGGYAVFARRSDAWDAVVSVLEALASEQAAYFHRLMRGCQRLSNAGYEIDGLDRLLAPGEQAAFDVGASREERRARQAYLTAAEARAFLQAARATDLAASAPPVSDVAVEHVRSAQASFEEPPARRPRSMPVAGVEPSDTRASVAALVNALEAEGVLPRPPAARLLSGNAGPESCATVRALLQAAAGCDAVAFATRCEELGFLANALVAGCALQGRGFTPQEASDAVLAVCNLGLQHWPRAWSRFVDRQSRVSTARAQHPGSGVAVASDHLPDDFLVERDLVGVFRVGWRVLHRDVCMHAARGLVRVLGLLNAHDRDIAFALAELRRALERHCEHGKPWQARDQFDVLAILDSSTWVGLLGLVAECPVVHPVVIPAPGTRILRLDPNAFAFISERDQVESVHRFIDTIHDRLVA